VKSTYTLQLLERQRKATVDLFFVIFLVGFASFYLMATDIIQKMRYAEHNMCVFESETYSYLDLVYWFISRFFQCNFF